MTTVKREKSASAEEVTNWCRVADDHNPIHLDEQYAADTRFGEPIVPGIMALGWVSGCLTQLGEAVEGDVILTRLAVEFKAPIPVGEEVTVVARKMGIEDSERGDEIVECYIELPDETKAVYGQTFILLDE